MTPSHESNIADFLQVSMSAALMGTLLRAESQVMTLRRFPWINELHWRITQRLYELDVDEELLRRALAKLRGERRCPIEIEPPRRLVAPSEHLTATGRSLARVLEAIQ